MILKKFRYTTNSDFSHSRRNFRLNTEMIKKINKRLELKNKLTLGREKKYNNWFTICFRKRNIK
jgi:hypothetical protein